MKKLLALFLALMMTAAVSAKTYLVEKVKGEVYIKTAEGEFIPVEAEDTIDDDDILVVMGDKSSITFILEDGTPVNIRKNINIKVSELLKR